MREAPRRGDVRWRLPHKSWDPGPLQETVAWWIFCYDGRAPHWGDKIDNVSKRFILRSSTDEHIEIQSILLHWGSFWCRWGNQVLRRMQRTRSDNDFSTSWQQQIGYQRRQLQQPHCDQWLHSRWQRNRFHAQRRRQWSWVKTAYDQDDWRSELKSRSWRSEWFRGCRLS